MMCVNLKTFFFSSRRRHTRLQGDWSSDVCSSDLLVRPMRDLPWRTYGGKSSGLSNAHRTCQSLLRDPNSGVDTEGKGRHAADDLGTGPRTCGPASLSWRDLSDEHACGIR